MADTDKMSAAAAVSGHDRASGLDLLLSTLADVQFETDADGALTGNLDRWERFSGQSPAEWAGLGWANAVHPDDRERAISGWAAAVATGSPYQTEYRLRRADGAWRWMRLTSAPVRDAGGAITRWVGIFTDVTDLHDLNARLAEQTRRFERALANSAITVFEQDRELRYSWVYNPALNDTPANIIGKTDPEMLDPAAASQLEALKRQVLTSGAPVRAEVTAQRPGDTPQHFDLQIEARRDAGGEITGIICAAFDITGRKATEAALKASEARYRLLFEQSVDGICVIDDDGGIVDVNPSCCQLFGHERPAFLQLGVRALLDPSEVPRLAGVWDRLEAGEAIAGEWVFRRRDGSTFIGEITGRRLAGELFQGIVRDVTERRRTESWLQGAHQTLSALVDRSPFGIYLVDADLRILQASEGARQAFAGVNPLIGRDLADAQRQIWGAAFAEEVIARFRHTLATGEPHAAESIEPRADRDATEAYDWRIERITLPDGRPGVVCHFYDLTERHRHDAHVALLMRELDHRARNMLTLVEAVARRTIAHEPRDFTERFSRRIQALAANQELLVRNSWHAVPITELVQSQLAFLGDMLGTRIHGARPGGEGQRRGVADAGHGGARTGDQRAQIWRAVDAGRPRGDHLAADRHRCRPAVSHGMAGKRRPGGRCTNGAGLWLHGHPPHDRHEFRLQRRCGFRARRLPLGHRLPRRGGAGRGLAAPPGARRGGLTRHPPGPSVGKVAGDASESGKTAGAATPWTSRHHGCGVSLTTNAGSSAKAAQLGGTRASRLRAATAAALLLGVTAVCCFQSRRRHRTFCPCPTPDSSIFDCNRPIRCSKGRSSLRIWPRRAASWRCRRRGWPIGATCLPRWIFPMPRKRRGCSRWSARCSPSSGRGRARRRRALCMTGWCCLPRIRLAMAI